MKQIIVNEKCIGCGMCMAVCPKRFVMNQQGKSEPVNDSDTTTQFKEEIADIQTAIDCCPVTAISIK